MSLSGNIQWKFEKRNENGKHTLLTGNVKVFLENMHKYEFGAKIVKQNFLGSSAASKVKAVLQHFVNFKLHLLQNHDATSSLSRSVEMMLYFTHLRPRYNCHFETPEPYSASTLVLFKHW